jgi:hypothetical protein
MPNQMSIQQRLLVELRLIPEILISPSKAIAELNKNPYWLGLFLVTVAGQLGLSQAVLPYVQRAVEVALPPGIPEAQVDTLWTQFKSWQHIACLVTPVLVLLKWALVATILWLILDSFTSGCNYRTVFSLVAYSNIIPFLGSIYLVIILELRGFDAIMSTADIQVPIGLNLLFRGHNVAVNTILGSINMFELWYIVILSIGIATIGKCSRKSAAAIAICYWLFTVAIQAGMAIIASSLTKGNLYVPE